MVISMEGWPRGRRNRLIHWLQYHQSKMTFYSCDLIRSLTMVPFFNNICDSTAKLFTQIKGKPLIVRKSLKMSLYLWSFPLWQIEDPVNNTAEKMGFKSRHNDKDNNSYVGLFTKPVATCHKCGKRSHIERDLKNNLLWL